MSHLEKTLLSEMLSSPHSSTTTHSREGYLKVEPGSKKSVYEKNASDSCRLELKAETEPMPGRGMSCFRCPDLRLWSCSTECTSLK